MAALPTLVRLAIPLLAVTLVCLAASPAATAGTPPPNDNYPGSTIHPPFEDSYDNTDATVFPGTPLSLCLGHLRHTMWWNFTLPETKNVAVSVSTHGDWMPHFIVWINSPFAGGGLDEVDCGNGYFAEDFSAEATAIFEAQAGEQYYIEVGGLDYYGENDHGPFDLSIRTIDPPSNDNMADATTVGSVPFEQQVDLTGATNEPDEPLSPCVHDSSSSYTFTNTVWYELTPAESARYLVTLGSDSPFAFPAFVVWTGPPGQLTEVACSDVLLLEAQAGTTYYIQVGVVTFYGEQFPTEVSFSIEPFPVPSCPKFTHSFTDPTDDIETWDFEPYRLPSDVLPSGRFDRKPFGGPVTRGGAPADMIGLEVAVGNETTCLAFRFESPPKPGQDILDLLAYIDADQDAATGLPYSDSPYCPGHGTMGVETIALPPPSAEGGLIRILDYSTYPAEVGTEYGYSSIEGDTITLALPTSLVTRNGRFDLTADSEVPGGIECLPNDGILTVEHALKPAFGDLNCDGRVDSSDTVTILASLAAVPTPTAAGCTALGEARSGEFPGGVALMAGDIDCNGDIEVGDALAMLTWLASSHITPAGCPLPSTRPK